jgi:5'-methylthioadenosine phosphorylase
MPKPVHILAKLGDISPLAVAVGDPARAEQLASMLSDARIVNANRGFLAYTGRYRNKGVTIATHGIGGPSASIIFEELYMLGARSIVRLGTCGGLTKDLGIGDFIIPTGAAHPNGSLRTYVTDGVLPPVPDLKLTSRLIEGCESAGAKFRSGVVFSSDAFYQEDPAHLKTWTSRGVIGVEMECATLFTLAALRGFRSASLLILSDSLVRKSESVMVSSEGLRKRVDVGGRIVLDAITS